MNVIDNIVFKNCIKKINLDNGLKVIFDQNDSVNLTAVGFYINKGSRDENNNQSGYSHFCEHMIFKGTQKLNKKEIACKFDKMGGFFNAYTTNELIVLYNVIPYFYLNESLILISDLINNSIFDNNEIDLEREVIINEIKTDMEDPQEIVYEDFMKNIFNNQSLGLPIIGSEISISNAKQNDLFDYYKEKFIIDNLTIVISGRFDQNEIIKLLNGINFNNNKKNKLTKLSKLTIDEKRVIQTNNSLSFTSMSSEQLHIVAGNSKFNILTEEFYYYSLINLIIGESMSSRLFQKIREELGLCYSIYSFFNKYRFENIFGIYLSTLPKNSDKIIESVSSILFDLQKNGFSEDELNNAKEQKIVELIINNDILQKRLNRIAFMDIILKTDYNIINIINQIKNISLNRINDILKEIIVKDNFFIQGLYKKNIQLKEFEF